MHFNFCILNLNLPAHMRCPIFNPHKRENVILWVGDRCVTELATHISIFISINRSGDGCGRRGRTIVILLKRGGDFKKKIPGGALHSPLRGAAGAAGGFYIVKCLTWDVALRTYPTCQCIPIGVLSTPRTHNVSRARA